MRASVKSWYLVGSARAKSVLKEIEEKEEKKEPKEKETVIILPKLISKEKDDTKVIVTDTKK